MGELTNEHDFESTLCEIRSCPPLTTPEWTKSRISLDPFRRAASRNRLGKMAHVTCGAGTVRWGAGEDPVPQAERPYPTQRVFNVVFNVKQRVFDVTQRVFNVKSF